MSRLLSAILSTSLSVGLLLLPLESAWIIRKTSSAASLTPTTLGGYGPVTGTNNSTTLDATGATNGALMLAFHTVRDGSFTISTPPSGWTQEANINVGTGANDPNVYVYSKIAGASEGTAVWTWSGSCYRSGQIIEIDGATSVTDFATAGNSDVLGVVTVAAGGIVVGYLGLCDTENIGTSEPPSGYTELSDRNGARRAGGNVSWADLGSGDTNGTDAFTRNDTSNTRATIHVAIQ